MGPIATKLKEFLQEYASTDLDADELVALFFKQHGHLLESATDEERWAMVGDLNQLIKDINLECIERKLGL